MRFLSCLLLGLLAVPAAAQEKKSLTIPWQVDWVTAVSFVGESKQVVAGNNVGQIAIWNVKDDLSEATPAFRLDGHTNRITHLAVTPDGRWLVSASLDHTVRVWDLQAPAKAKGMLALEGPQYKRKIVQSGDATKEAPVEIKQATVVLTEHQEWVHGMSLSADGKRLLTGDDKGLMILWQMPEGKELKRIQAKGWLRGVAISPDGRQAVSSSFSHRRTRIPNENLVWDLETGKTLLDLNSVLVKAKGDGGAGMESVAFSSDGKTVAFTEGGEFINSSGKIFLVDVQTGKKLRDLPGHASGGVAVDFSPDGKLLATGGRDTTVRIWQVSDGKKLADLGEPRGGQFRDWIHSVAFSADGRWVAAGDMAGFVQIFRLGN